MQLRYKLLIAAVVVLTVGLTLLGGGWVLYRRLVMRMFNVPTGAMATVICGRHKDVICPTCGYRFNVSASGEVPAGDRPPCRVVGATCPMCRRAINLAGLEDQFPSHRGDYVPVSLLAYRSNGPARWDVAVFRYPHDPKVNFIMRVVGLPNETVRIRGGDVFVAPSGTDKFTIVRKPPETVFEMLQPVYDNNCVLPDKLLAQGWPARWQVESDGPNWTTADDHRSFSSDGSTDGKAWLRYHHFVPDGQLWKTIEHQALPADYRPAAQLISDFCAYNTALCGPGGFGQPAGLGLHWVGDLAVSCTLKVRNAQGKVVFELVEGGRQFQCQIDVATGRTELSIPGESFRRAATTAVSRPGTYHILFANVDDQLLLWVDDELVSFDGPTTYESLDNHIPQPSDLAPVGIATEGADVQVSDLEVMRDVYYIAVSLDDGFGFGGMCDYEMPQQHFGGVPTAQSIGKFLSDPAKWAEAFSEASMRSVEFPLGARQYFVLGDNSPQSKDSRLWGDPYYVLREQFVGKMIR